MGVPTLDGGFVQQMSTCTRCGGLTFSLVVLTLLECIVLMLFGDSSLLPFCTLWTCEGQSCNWCPLSACRHLWINIFRWGSFAPPGDFTQKVAANRWSLTRPMEAPWWMEKRRRWHSVALGRCCIHGRRNMSDCAAWRVTGVNRSIAIATPCLE